jgi:DNA-binding phage protein
MQIETALWDPAKRLTTREAIAEYLKAALDDEDAAVPALALDDIARSRSDRDPLTPSIQPEREVPVSD